MIPENIELDHRPVIVCGLGHIGFQISILLRRLHLQVVVVTDSPETDLVTSARQAGVQFVFGDATYRENLIEAGIMEAQALIACTSSDLTNLEIAIDARSIRSDLRIVARIFDFKLAAKIGPALSIDAIRSMSMLSAPIFIAEALQSIKADRNTLGSFVYQGVKHKVKADLTDQSIVIEETTMVESAVRVRKIRRSVWKQIFTDMPTELKFLSLTVAILAAISVVFFYNVLDLSLIDSIYFVITTLSTTGYGDITVRNEGWMVKLFSCLVMLVGSASIAVMYSVLTNYILSNRIQDIFGPQQTDFKDHVIVVGLGNLGLRVAESLDQLGETTVVIDVDQNVNYRNLLPPTSVLIVGDAREPHTLERANLIGAKAILSVTSDDSMNLSIGFLAQSIAPNVPSVVRIFEPNFAQKLRNRTDQIIILSGAELCAPGFVGAAICPESCYNFVWENHFYSIGAQRKSNGDLSSEHEFSIGKISLNDASV